MTSTGASQQEPKKKRVDLHVTMHLTKWEKRWLLFATVTTLLLFLFQILYQGHL